MIEGRCRPRARRGARLPALVAAWAALTIVVDARAELETRAVRMTWDRAGLLRASFSFRNVLDDKALIRKLSNGLPLHVVMRGYVYPNDGGDPVALTARTCKVAYDLWNEVFRVVVDGISRPPVVNMNGVHRLCTEMTDLPVADRATLGGRPSEYFMAVKVEVNPVSAEVMQKIQQWVTRPSGAAGSIGPGDALFASFVGAFMRRTVTADRVLEFRTASFPNPP